MKKILNLAVLQIFIIDLALIINLHQQEKLSVQTSLSYGFFLIIFHGVIVIRSLYNQFYDKFYEQYKK